MSPEVGPVFRSTTVLAVRVGSTCAMAGDGQVTLEANHTIIKSGARKVRKLYRDSIAAGFAGSVGDAFTLFDKLEGHLEETRGDLLKAAVELAKEWRTDRILRQLQAVQGRGSNRMNRSWPSGREARTLRPRPKHW